MIVEDRKKSARLAEKKKKTVIKAASKPGKAADKARPSEPPVVVETATVDDDVAPELSACAVILLSDILDNISDSESVRAMPAIPDESDYERVDSDADEDPCLERRRFLQERLEQRAEARSASLPVAPSAVAAER